MPIASLTTPSDASPEPSATLLTDQQIQKAFSCVLCAQRKVRCDKKPGGCNNCTKARVPCVYKAPPPPRRRKKGVRDVDVTIKLRIYEDALRKAGIDPETLLKEEFPVENAGPSNANGKSMSGLTQTSSKEPDSEEIGILVTEYGKSRYLENGIWTSLRSEFRDLKEILDETSDEESSDNVRTVPEPFSPDGSRFLFGSPVPSAGLRHLHPKPVEAFKLWQAYLDNINPLIKLFHAPTVQQMISEANSNLDEVPRNMEALLFSIYCIAVESLSSGECIAITGESKDAARQRFRSGAQHALINVSFLKTSDITVLQALTLFIVSLQDIDARIIWILSGVTQRIGQRIGLHRDGDILKLPPFDAEIRRRLWWQIIMLEGFSQKLAGTGTGTNASILIGDVKMPANLNDSDLFPGMKQVPKESDRATEMMFFLIRCHFGEFLRRLELPKAMSDGVWNKLTTKSVDMDTKEKAIKELEHLFEQQFLRHCDNSIVWHLMCTHLAKAIIFMMRFTAYGANYQGKTGSQTEKDLLFSLALQVCSSQNLAYAMKEMQGFIWHVHMHFQWKAFVYILSELRYRTSGSEVEQAWKNVQLTYEFHPTFDKELSTRALPIAVSNLALKAWEAYIAANGTPHDGEPYFIQLIRNRQDRPKKLGHTARQSSPSSTNVTPSFTPEHSQQSASNEEVETDSSAIFDWTTADLSASLNVPSDSVPLDYPEGMDWSTWNDLLVDFQKNDVNFHSSDLAAFDFDV